MKKNLFFGMFATMVLLLTTACQKENDLLGNGEATISFEISTPQMATRAFSDGTTATELKYAVYHKVGENFVLLRGENKAQLNGKKAHVDVQLATGKTYYVFFWAQHPDAPFEPDYDALTMKVNYGNCNDENYDAFYWFDDVTVEGAATVDVTLKRPFAQLNIGTNDLAKIDDVSVAETAVTVKNVYDTFNFASGNVVGNATQVTFAATARPASEAFPVTGYEYLAMNYMFVQQEGDVLNEVIFTYDNGNKSRTFTNIPVKPNHRTNIYGALLTNNIGFDVEIEEDFDGDAVSTEAEKLIVAAQTGGTYTLTEDIILTEALNVTAEFTLDLNGHNIYIDATYDNSNYEASSAIVNGDKGVLTLTGNGEIKAENNYTVRNNGKMVIDGVTIKNGVMNFGDLTIESGSISNDRSGKHAIYGNNAKLTVNGGTFHNENAGNATIFAYAGEVIINDGVFTIADGTATFGWTSCVLDAQGSAKFTINGGKVNGEIRDYNNNTTIYGGTYSVKPNANFIAEGYTAIEKDGKWTVVAAANNAETLAAAIAKGGVVALTEDITATEVITIPEGTTAVLDLNGKNVTATTSSAFEVKAGANLTIKNGNVTAHEAVVRAIGGEVTIESGKFVQTGTAVGSTPATYRYCVDVREDGKATINGGEFTSGNGLLNVNAGGEMVINGGKFENKVEEAMTRHFAYVGGKLTINDGEFKGVANSGAGGCFFCGAAAGCDIQVNGGKFTSLWSSGSVNRIFEVYFGGTINVTGGLFNTNGGIATFVEANTDEATKDAYPYKAK
ncbi:MAG: hypothetical protein IKY13_05675 [Bacteroidaceae bacterium]|nr:hypothetical protein [Bacteroidaceae bacterium]